MKILTSLLFVVLAAGCADTEHFEDSIPSSTGSHFFIRGSGEVLGTLSANGKCTYTGNVVYSNDVTYLGDVEYHGKVTRTEGL